MSKPNLVFYNLHMENQTTTKPFGLIKDLKKKIMEGLYGYIYYYQHQCIRSSYSMLLGQPWLKDAKLSHNWGTNIITIQGTDIITTILITKKLSVQAKRP